jgi:leucyl-tRNA synthetase
MSQHPFWDIEPKWRRKWDELKVNKADLTNFKNKIYCLVMFSYPSGAKLHIGHWFNYGGADTWTRFMKMKGYNTFEPMGFDAFGLPAENYAIKTGIHPAISTKDNVNFIREQLKYIGAMYDWDYEVNTSLPEYYKWTQWLFLTLYKAGLAYRKAAPVNWCPTCQTVLANEQVENGVCERGHEGVTKKFLTQWFFKITDYADKLINDLDKIDWPESTKSRQRNWIGKSEGASILFPLENHTEKLEVFTTRPDTLFGATYMVLAPEHDLVNKITTKDHKHEVQQYISNTLRVSEIERISTEREKTGVFTGAYAINPLSGERIPIWIADYVLIGYGTGAIMAVPAHDERDFAFAVKYDIPIIEVISANGNPAAFDLEQAYTEAGIMVNSSKFNGLNSEIGKSKVIAELKTKNLGDSAISYRLRDWLISRQRYWGAPIPMIHCPTCGEVPVPEKDLPVLLPGEIDLKLDGSGLSPLARAESWKNVLCPKCHGAAERDTDTMDTFVCSSWYFLRFLTPKDSNQPFDKELCDKWFPIDHYIGGPEHATGHLIFARFITKALHDLGYLTFDEPFQRLTHQGIITKDNARMSKSRGNTVNPDLFVDKYGSDVFRMYLQFMGAFQEGGEWTDEGIQGIVRFLDRLWRHYDEPIKGHPTTSHPEQKNLLIQLNRTIKIITEDIEKLTFNTAIARLMELINYIYTIRSDAEKEGIYPESMNILNMTLPKLIAPFAPHLAEEIWERIGNNKSIFLSDWPNYNPNLLNWDEVTIVVQINGKLRSKVAVPIEASEEQIKEIVLAQERIQELLLGKVPKKIIVVPGRLINIVI